MHAKVVNGSCDNSIRKSTCAKNLKNGCCHQILGNVLSTHSRLVYGLPCLLATICYLNGLTGDFVHDDVFAIQNNSDVTGKSALSDVFRNDFWGTPMDQANSHKSYRPLCILSFRLDYYISGGNPTWFHVVNTALHVCVTFVLTHVSLNVLQASRMCALLSACLFAVHPVHTEAVTGLVGRADVLAALFFLVSLSLYSRCVSVAPPPSRDINDNKITNVTNKPRSDSQLFYFLTSLVTSTAAMLCKETGVTVLAICLFYDLLYNRRLITRAVHSGKFPTALSSCLSRWLLLILMAGVLLMLRMWVMDFQEPTVFQEEANPASFSTSRLTRVLTFSYLPTFNFWLLLCPAHLSYDWTGSSIPLLTSLTDYRNLCTLTLYIPALALAWKCFRNLWAQDSADEEVWSSPGYLPVMAASLMVVPYLPASNLFFRVGFVVAERILYIPSMGYCLLVGHGFLAVCSKLPKFRGQLLVMYLFFLMVMCARTWDRNTVWQSRQALFKSGVKSLPNNAKVHYNMANFLKDEGDRLGAEKHYRRAVSLYPHVASYHLNLGTMLTNKTEAQHCYLEALRLRPGHPGALVNLGSLLLELGDPSGLSYVEQALTLDPSHLEAHITMGYSMMSSKNYSQAEYYVRQALRLKPDSAKSHLCYAVYLHNIGQSMAALDEYELTLKLDPRESYAVLNSAKILLSLHRYKEAEVRLKRAIRLDPDCSDCYTQLGIVYSKLGLSKDAVVTLGQATTLAPNNTFVNLKYIQVLKESGQREDAWTRLHHLLNLFPSDLEILRFAFRLAMEEHKLTQANNFIQEAISIAEQGAGGGSLGELYQDMAEVYRLNGDYEKALKFYEKAVQINHSLVDSIINAGTIHYHKRNFQQAETYYLQAMDIAPNNQLARKNLERLHQHTSSTRR